MTLTHHLPSKCMQNTTRFYEKEIEENMSPIDVPVMEASDVPSSSN